MSLIGRILTEKRVAVTAVAVAVVVATGLYALAVYPLAVRVADARVREAVARDSLDSAQQSLQAARAVMDGKNATSEQLDRFYREVLPPDLPGARHITYARLAALASAYDLVMERRSSVSEQDESNDLARLGTTMLLAGEWSNIRQFIAAVEDAPEFIVIQDIVLSQSEEAGASLALALGVSTYYRVEAGV